MKGINDFLIKVESEYENKIIVAGKELILTSLFEDAQQLLKVAEVIAAPINNPTGAKKGDFIVFSHLIMRETFDGKNNKTNNEYLIDDKNKIYAVPLELMYAYINDGNIYPIAPYVFVKPIVMDDTVLPSGIILPTKGKEVPQVGTLEYINDELEGYDQGDTVIFEKDSEYEVKIFGERFYRMRNEWILAKYES